MTVAFDTLSAAEALEQSGMDTRQARVCAAQMSLAAQAGEPVTREQFEAGLEAGLTRLKIELLERIAEGEAKMLDRIAEGEAKMLDRIAEGERRMREHVTALLWRFFGGAVALAGLVLFQLNIDMFSGSGSG